MNSESEDDTIRPRRDFNSTGELMDGPTPSGRRTARRRQSRNTAGGDDSDSAVSQSAESVAGARRNSRMRGGDSGAMTPGSSKRSQFITLRGSDRSRQTRSGEDSTAPRSPTRRRPTISGPVDEGDDEEEEGQDEEDAAQGAADTDLYDELDDDILRIDQPPHMMPLTFAYNPRDQENAIQPLVVAPVPHPTFPDILATKSGYVRRSELDILNGDTDTVTLLGDDLSSGNTAAMFAPNGELLGTKTRRADGLFVAESPVLAGVLLNGEPPATLSTVTGFSVSPQLNLARITQRTLRDLHVEAEAEKCRQRWAELTRPHDLPRNPAGTEETPALAPARLLQNLSVGPLTQIIENPIDLQVSQPIIPDTNASYGGKLGSWSSSATTKERLGTLPGGDRSNKAHRSVLRVHVHQITIVDHPLVSEEERSYSSLKSSFSVYRSLMEQNTLVYLSNRLVGLYDELGRLLAEHERAAGSGEEEIDHETVIALHASYSDLTETILALSELRQAVDSMTSGIYEQWTSLQKIRRGNGFSSTKAQLIARRLRGGGSDEDDDAVSESKDQGALDSALWSSLSRALTGIPALVRRAQDVLLANDKLAVDTAGTATTSASTIEPGGKNMIKLSPRGAAKALEAKSDKTPRSRQLEVRNRYTRIFEATQSASTDLLKRKGLAPEYVLRLSDTGSITPTAQVNAEEQRRRKAIEQLQFKVTVMVNGVAVTQSNVASLSFPSLSVDFKQFFEFRLLHQPTSLALEVVSVKPSKTGITKDTTVATVCVPLPGQRDPYMQALGALGNNATSNVATGAYAPSVGWLSFSSESAPLGRPSALPSGISNNQRGELPVARVNGLILCVAEYDSSHSHDHSGQGGRGFDGISLYDLAQIPPAIPPTGSLLTGLSKGSRSAGVSQRILQGYQTLDPNDPRNDAWLKVARRADSGSDFEGFHLTGLDMSVPFGEDGTLYQNFIKFQGSLRMQLLQLRQVKPYLFADPIPMSDAEIKRNDGLKAIVAGLEPDPLMNLGEELTKDEIEAANDNRVRSKISSFLERVRQGQVAQAVRGRKKLTTTGAVSEVKYFTPNEPMSIADLIPEPRRGLRPLAKPRQPSTSAIKACNILVQVVGARNVPLREEVAPTNAKVPGSPKKSRSRGGYSSGESDTEARGEGAVAEEFLDETKLEFQRRAKTFMEVRFQNQIQRTGVNAGRSPLWKESLSLPLTAPNSDFSPSNLTQISDNIIFTLFDECAEDYSWSGSLYSDEESTIFFERRYLGSFVLPFSTLWASAGGRVEGVFRLDLPCLNFGYVPAPPLAATEKLDSSMFQEDPNTGLVTQQDDPLHEPTLLETIFALVGLKGLAQGWSERRVPQSELRDYGTHVRPVVEKEFEFYVGNQSTTYVKLMVTLDPILNGPVHVPQDVAYSSLYSEDKVLAGPARMWLKSVHGMSKYTKERPYKLFGKNTRGLSVLLCRYLQPMKPPPGYVSRRSCIHLVSLLPFMADAQTFSGESDMWCTTKEVWDTGAGDEEEHATLLFNYLYYLHHVDGSDESIGAAANVRESRTVKMRKSQLADAPTKPTSYPTPDFISKECVFLVIGKAVPEGDSVYVMIKDAQAAMQLPYAPANYLLINPCTGQVFPAADPRCPLIEIACIVTPYNIWGNIQAGGAPCELSFDLLNPDSWRPFYGVRLPSPNTGIHSIQDPVTYSDTSVAYAMDLEKVLKDA